MNTEYYIIESGERRGPYMLDALRGLGITKDTLVWRQGLADWTKASELQELAPLFVPDMPGVRNSYGQQPYGHSGYVKPESVPHFDPYKQRTNWLPWAIAGTVVGFLFSCIGVIFGIIAIVQANKANEAFAIGNEIGGEQANNTAKTMTIIALAFGGVGLITTVIGTVTGLFSTLAAI